MFLVLDVVSDGELVDADGGYEVTSGPHRAWGKLFGLLFDPGRSFSLQDLDDVGSRILGWNRKVEMDVLIPDVPLQYFQPFPLGDKLEHSLEF